MKKILAILSIFMFLAVGVFAGPDRIVNLTVTNRMGNSIGFNWNVPYGAISNDVRISTNAINTPNWNSAERLDYLDAAWTPGKTQFVTVIDLTTNTTYFVAVKTQGTNGWSIMSNLAKVTTGGDTATVTLEWRPSVSTNAAGYNVYHGTSLGGPYGDKTIVGNTTTATIDKLIWGKPYFFVATTVDTAGNESGFSNETEYAPGKQ